MNNNRNNKTINYFLNDKPCFLLKEYKNNNIKRNDFLFKEQKSFSLNNYSINRIQRINV